MQERMEEGITSAIEVDGFLKSDNLLHVLGLLCLENQCKF